MRGTVVVESRFESGRRKCQIAAPKAFSRNRPVSLAKILPPGSTSRRGHIRLKVCHERRTLELPLGPGLERRMRLIPIIIIRHVFSAPEDCLSDKCVALAARIVKGGTGDIGDNVRLAILHLRGCQCLLFARWDH